MKALVAVKRVVDHHVRVRVKADGSDVDTNNVKMSINPFDEIAVEEAVRLKERGVISEVVAVSIGTHDDVLRTALAMGSDRAIHIETDQALESLAVAKLLKAVVDQENPSLILLGKQAIDDDANQTAQMLAALLHAPQGTFASKLELVNDQWQVTREVDGGLETVSLRQPAVVSTDLRLNEPRYIKLPNIMQAKKKPITKKTPQDLGVAVVTLLEVLQVTEPPVRSAGQQVANVAELLSKLKNEAKVL